MPKQPLLLYNQQRGSAGSFMYATAASAAAAVVAPAAVAAAVAGAITPAI